jgi:hypothetical protein
VLTALLLAVTQSPPPPVSVPRGTLVVHLVDPDGELVLEDFVVNVSPFWPAALGERGPVSKALFDPQTGTATFEHLSAGRYVVEAEHKTGDWAMPVEVDLTAHARLSCELRLATPPPSRCLYVVAGGPELVDGLQLVARATTGETFVLTLAEGALNRYVARGVQPGRYTISVVDPRYRATSIEDVLPGEVAQLALEGSAALALRFRAVAGGEVLRPRGLELVLDGAAQRQRGFQPTSTSPTWRVREDPSLDELDGLEPGDLFALAHFAEHAPVSFRVADLRHGERRELEVEVPLGATLTGRVVDAIGQPVAGVLVQTHTTLELGAEEPWRVWLEPSGVDKPRPVGRSRADAAGTRRVVHTDGTGRYAFSGLAPGTHVVTAYGTPFTQRSVSTDIGAERDRHTVPDIVLGGSASADIDVWLPAEVNVSELQLVLKIGSGSWLKQITTEPLSLRGEPTVLQLRGLPEEACTLVVSHRNVVTGRADDTRPLARVTFTPKRGTPTPVVLDARQQ